MLASGDTLNAALPLGLRNGGHEVFPSFLHVWKERTKVSPGALQLPLRGTPRLLSFWNSSSGVTSAQQPGAWVQSKLCFKL